MTPPTTVRPLYIIAQEAMADMDTQTPNAGYSFLKAMATLNTVEDMYYEDTAKSVVRYFLSNTQTWKGNVARRIKAELKAMMK